MNLSKSIMNGDDDDDDGDECDIDGNILCGIIRHDCCHYDCNAIINHLNNDICVWVLLFFCYAVCLNDLSAKFRSVSFFFIYLLLYSAIVTNQKLNRK